MDDPNEDARKELIRRGVIQPGVEPEPAEPAEEPAEPEPAVSLWLKAPMWCSFLPHAWTGWADIRVKIVAGDQCIGEKSHQRRQCARCLRIEIAEVFV